MEPASGSTFGFKKMTSLLGALLLSVGVVYLGYFVDRTELSSLLPGFLLAFGGYALLITRTMVRRSLAWLCVLGVGLRLALVFAFPLLSDDLYRFLWDGYLINAGENPFAHLPAWYLEPGNEIPGLSRELYDRLNSPDYYTIYPPVAQGVFTTATWLFPESWYGAAVVIKVMLLACELGSLWLLWRMLGGLRHAQEGPGTPVRGRVEERGELPDERGGGQRLSRPTPPLAKDGASLAGLGRAGQVPVDGVSSQRAAILLYWLNPLIIVEITGNLHFEGAMVFFLLLAYYLLRRSAWVRAGLAFAAAVASKLLPLLLLPYLIRRLWRRQPDLWVGSRPFWIFSVAFGASTLLFFSLLLLSPDFLSGFRESLKLYQQKFEFNASLYYLARQVGYWQVGWNQIATIGPWLAKASAVGILLLALLDGRSDWRSLPAGWLFAFVLYLLCATTVHPWYLSVPIALCVFTRWRFPLVWSFLIMLTYTNYLTEPYEEQLWLVAVEYLLVAGFALWEWRRCRASEAFVDVEPGD